MKSKLQENTFLIPKTFSEALLLASKQAEQIEKQNNQLTNKNLYQLNTTNNDQVNIVFGDGSFSNIPSGPFRFYFRTSNGASYTINPDDLSSVIVAFTVVVQPLKSVMVTV